MGQAVDGTRAENAGEAAVIGGSRRGGRAAGPARDFAGAVGEHDREATVGRTLIGGVAIVCAFALQPVAAEKYRRDVARLQ